MTADQPKIALVTGAARRIGRSIALALAQRGWDVAVHYRAFRRRRAGHGAPDRGARPARAGRCTATWPTKTRCDGCCRASPRSLVPVSCVVNNASLFDYDDAAGFSQARLDAHMHANLAAPILLAQALHAATPEGAQGVVINLLDQKLFNLNPDFLSYTLSKAALHSATTMLAQALAPKVRVVGVAPGITLVSGDQTEEASPRAQA